MFEAEELVRKAIKRHKNIAVACSFGKDSIVVLHMALKYSPNIKVVFNDTGVEFPETIKYAKEITKLWKLNLAVTRPIKSFWDCFKEYGPPGIRGRGKVRVPKCCVYCKEKPAFKVYKEKGIDAIFTGIMGTESRQRSMLVKRYDNAKLFHDGISMCGQRYYARSQNMWKYHPLAHWEDEDVLKYIKDNNIPINPVYKKWSGIYKRTGCLPCTAYLDWEKKLSKTHPKLYLKIKNMIDPEQNTLK